MPGCDGTAAASPFLIPGSKPNTAKPATLWECQTCGALWRADGTFYSTPKEDTP